VSNALAIQMAQRFGVNENEVMSTLKATAFKGQVSDGQMTALMIVANQYGLNPWTKEIYAFPDKNNGIVPVVGVDGWSRIINENPQFDGMEFNEADNLEWIECVIYRKDRRHPVKIKEYMSECKRDAGPWKSHPRRMLRHKAMIQCARLAFGYVGIYDQDEAERIIEKDMGVAHVELDSVDTTDLISKVDAATSSDELALIWKSGLAEIKAANDMPAYTAFKAAVEAHGKKLKGEA
jgi:phage recombination protein Bet